MRAGAWPEIAQRLLTQQSDLGFGEFIKIIFSNPCCWRMASNYFSSSFIAQIIVTRLGIFTATPAREAPLMRRLRAWKSPIRDTAGSSSHLEIRRNERSYRCSNKSFQTLGRRALLLCALTSTCSWQSTSVGECAFKVNEMRPASTIDNPRSHCPESRVLYDKSIKLRIASEQRPLELRCSTACPGRSQTRRIGCHCKLAEQDRSQCLPKRSGDYGEQTCWRKPAAGCS